MSKDNLEKLVLELGKKGYLVWQFGAETDWCFFDDFSFKGIGIVERFNHLSFFDQIRMTLETDLMIGTDSGSALIVGAYEHRQISLLTDHWNNANNPMALSTNNPNNYTFFAPGGCDNISVDEIISKVKDMVKQ